MQELLCRVIFVFSLRERRDAWETEAPQNWSKAIGCRRPACRLQPCPLARAGDTVPRLSSSFLLLSTSLTVKYRHSSWTVFKNLQTVRFLPGKITQVRMAKSVSSYCVFRSVLWSNSGQLLKAVHGHICLRCSILTENLEELTVC